MNLKILLLAAVWAVAVAFVVHAYSSPKATPDSESPALESNGDEVPLETSPSVSPPRLLKLIDGIQEPSLSMTDLPIIGYVVDETDMAVSGAKILAVPARAWKKDLAKRLEARIHAAKLQRRFTQKTDSDEKGRFELTGLAATLYDITATHPRFRFRKERSIAPGKVVAIKAIKKPGESVEFDLRLPNGKAPQQAQITLSSDGQPRSQSWSPEESHLNIDLSGILKVSAVADETFYCEPFDLDLEEYGKDPVQIDLKQIGAVQIQISEANPGKSILDFYILKIDASRPPGNESLKGGRSLTYFRNNEKRLFDKVPAGDYLVGVGSGSRIWDSQIVTVGTELLEVEFDLLHPDSTNCILVRVLGPDGNSLQDVSFSKSIASKSRRSSGGVDTTLLGADEIYRIALSPEEVVQSQQPETVLTLTVTSREHGDLSQIVNAIDSTPIEFSFGHSAEVTLVLTGDESAFDKIDIQLVKEGSTDINSMPRRMRRKPQILMGRNRGTTDTNQRSLGTVQAGNYDLVALVYVGMMANVEISRRSISIGRGTQTISFDAPKLYELAIEQKTHTPILFKQQGSDEQKALYLQGESLWLPSGEYQFCQLGKSTWQTANIPETSVINLDIQR